MLDGLRGEDSIFELCRREGISQGIYYKWSKDFMEAGKRRLAGDTARAANTDEVRGGGEADFRSKREPSIPWGWKPTFRQPQTTLGAALSHVCFGAHFTNFLLCSERLPCR